jgi:DNA-binding NarL/FixJ family response regulator
VRIKVLIADDHPVVRRGLANLLEGEQDIEVVGQAGNGVEALELARDRKPDVVLIDLRMPEMDGVEAIRRMRTENQALRFIILTTYDNEEWVFEGIRAGARGYLLKDSEPDEFVSAIRAIMRGESLIEPVVATRLLDRFSELANKEAGKGIDAPTERELEVLRLMARGASNGEIADELIITVKTVKTHVAHILGKLQAKNRTEAVTEAARRGWIKL